MILENGRLHPIRSRFVVLRYEAVTNGKCAVPHIHTSFSHPIDFLENIISFDHGFLVWDLWSLHAVLSLDETQAKGSKNLWELLCQDVSDSSCSIRERILSLSLSQVELFSLFKGMASRDLLLRRGTNDLGNTME